MLGIVIPYQSNFPLDEKIKEFNKKASQAFEYFFDIINTKRGKGNDAANRTTIDLFLLEVIAGVDHCQVNLV